MERRVGRLLAPGVRAGDAPRDRERESPRSRVGSRRGGNGDGLADVGLDPTEQGRHIARERAQYGEQGRCRVLHDVARRIVRRRGDQQQEDRGKQCVRCQGRYRSCDIGGRFVMSLNLWARREGRPESQRERRGGARAGFGGVRWRRGRRRPHCPPCRTGRRGRSRTWSVRRSARRRSGRRVDRIPAPSRRGCRRRIRAKSW